MIKKPEPKVRARCFSFTISTCGDLPEERFNNLKGVEFIIYQEKISTSSKTRYFQGVIRYINQKDFLALKKEIGFNAQLEIVRNKNDMIFFCQKLQETISHIYTIGNVPQFIEEKLYHHNKIINDKLIERINDNTLKRISEEIMKKIISFKETKEQFPMEPKVYKFGIDVLYQEQAWTTTNRELFIFNIVSEPGLGKTVFIRKFCKLLDLNYEDMNIEFFKKFYSRMPSNTNSLIIDLFLPTDDTIQKFNKCADDVETNYNTKKYPKMLKVDFLPLITNVDFEYVEKNVKPFNYKKIKERINLKMNFSRENDKLVICMESYDKGNSGSLLHKKTFTIQTRFLETDNIEAMKTIIDMMISNCRVNNMTNSTFFKRLELARMKLEETSL